MVIIIHCTSHCNMGCRYCYEENWMENTITIDKINSDFEKAIPIFVKSINEVVELKREMPVDILLHGGEPLLIRPNIMSKFISEVKMKHPSLKFKIQTNGTLLTDEYIELFKKYSIPVGVSLDGPQHLNDINRVFKGGKGTFSTVMENIKKARYKNVRVGGLLTLTATNVKNIKEIYDFFKEEKLDFSFNPFFEPDQMNYGDLKMDETDYAAAVCELFDLWINDQENTISIKYFEKIIEAICYPESGLKLCMASKDCSKQFISIDVEGNVAQCNHFAIRPEYYYGNVCEKSIKELWVNKNMEYRWDTLNTGECENCNYSNFCYGGCPYHSVVKFNDLTHKAFNCESTKIIIDHILKKLHECI